MSAAAPNIPAPPGETPETGQTYSVGNDVFLEEIFGNDPSSVARPILVSFIGNPAKTEAKSWNGKPWMTTLQSTKRSSSQANNYFSLATFTPDKVGQYRRRKAEFHAVHAIMLDDVGTKVAMDLLTLPPSWLLETSSGNYQAGYVLAQPLTDGAKADQIMNEIIAAGLCDPGANGPRSRLARLPDSVNGKGTPPFPCRLKIWSPETRYTVDELLNGLGIELTLKVPVTRSSAPSKGRSVDRDDVWLPSPDKNAVLIALRERGLYKAPLGEGKHNITCPWVAEHTDKLDGGTAYFEPDDNWHIGGFKCLHGHCATRHIKDLLNYVGIEVKEARMKPTIRVVAGEIHRIVDAGERVLANSRRHYQRGGLIVTVVTDPASRETRVQDVSQPALVRALAGAAAWERFDGRTADWIRIDPPARHTSVLFDSASYTHLPVLTSLTRQPYLRPDGSLMNMPGHDPATGMFGVFDAREYSVPEKPTEFEARAALDLLKELLCEFRFQSDSDLSAALAAILTATVRPSLINAPMFHVQAHMAGSGKSYLCQLITAFATPQRGTPTAFPADDEECRKLLLAELLRAPAVIEFDNLTSELVAHKSLCTVLTSEHISGRILGVSKTVAVNTRTLFLSSGNNVGPVDDMTRRCLSIHLDPGCEMPAARSFGRPELVREVLRDRGRFVSAALTIVRAWIQSGKTRLGRKSLAGFGEWSDLCCEPLVWLGMPDPTVSVFDAITEDPERETLGRLLSAWHTLFGKSPTMIRDALTRIASDGFDPDCQNLHEVFRDIAGERDEINRRKLGRWIKRYLGRIVEGRRFRRSGSSNSSESWLVDSVSQVSTVSRAQTELSADELATSAEEYLRASRGS